MKYQEIVNLYQWCKENGIICTIEPLFDGFKIAFVDSSDIVQHCFSYGSEQGCVEPGGMERAYTAVDVATIKEILLKKFK